jgi:CO/xanthine dehydrogenase FAD-binding subunit
MVPTRHPDAGWGTGRGRGTRRAGSGSVRVREGGRVEEAITLLDRFGDTARLVAGGRSLLPMMKLRLASFEYLIGNNDPHDELGYVRVRPGEVRIGALVRHRELLESDELAAVLPVFRDAERVIADPVVRNRGRAGWTRGSATTRRTSAVRTARTAVS